MARFGSVAEWTGPAGVTTLASFTCCHCNTVVIVPPRAPADDCGGFCLRCMKPTCKPCASLGCTPFERQLEQYEYRMRLRAQIGAP